MTWHTLAHRGIAVRGPEPDRLGIRVDSAELEAWTRGNLDGYWRAWVMRARRAGSRGARALPRRHAAAGVLGVSRLHYTLATGGIATKEAAGRYALEAFGSEWHTIVEDALGFWRGAPSVRGYRRHPARRTGRAAEFVAHVIDASLGPVIDASPGPVIDASPGPGRRHPSRARKSRIT